MNVSIKTFWRHPHDAERDGDAIIIPNPETYRRRRLPARSLVLGLSVLAAIGAALGTLWQARLTRDALQLTRNQISLSREQYETQQRQFEGQLAAARRQVEEQTATTAKQLKLTQDAVLAMRDNAQASLESARSARESSTFAKTSFQTSHRAYMIMETASLDSQPMANQPLPLTMIFRNVGLTPARQVNASWKVFVLLNGTAIERLSDFGHVEFGNTTIGPNLFFKAKPDSNLAEASKKALAEGQGLLIVHTVVVYLDIFGEKHLTESCVAWQKNSPLGLELGFCPAGFLDIPAFN